MKVCEKHQVENSITKTANNYNLCCKAKELLRQLQPDNNALDKIQRGKATLSDAAEAWANLETTATLKPRVEFVQRRRAQAIQKIHGAANILDPRDLSSSERRWWRDSIL